MINKVFILPEEKVKLDLYVKLCPLEISGLGRVKKIGSNLLIEKVYLFRQKVSPSTTEIENQDVSNFILSLLKNNEDTSNIKCWWHSHVNMDVFWSLTDINTIQNFSQDWMVSLVLNKRGESEARIDVFKPIRVAVTKLPLLVYPDEINQKLVNDIKKEIEEKIEKQTYKRKGEQNDFDFFGFLETGRHFKQRKIK